MEQSAQHPFKGRRALVLWVGWLVGPIAWALHENVSYLLAPWACVAEASWSLHLTTVAAAILAATGCLTAWRSLRSIGGWRHATADRITARSRFLAMGGIVLSTLSILGILAEGGASLVLDPCLGLG